MTKNTSQPQTKSPQNEKPNDQAHCPRRRVLSLDLEVLEERIAPAALGGFRGLGSPVWRVEDCCQ